MLACIGRTMGLLTMRSLCSSTIGAHVNATAMGLRLQTHWRLGVTRINAGARQIVSHPLAVDAAKDSNYVIEMRGSSPKKRLDFGPDRRIYMVEPITEADAEELAHGFGADVDLDWLRWEAC